MPGPLKGLWLQKTSVAGDIVALLEQKRNLQYLHIGQSQISGKIENQWMEGLGIALKELSLPQTKITFNMTCSQCRDKTALKPFPNVSQLDVTGCQLNMDVWDFLHPFAYNYPLVEVVASKCGLFGKVHGIFSADNYPLFWQLRTLDLSGNNITALDGKPRPSMLLDVSNNPNLSKIPDQYFGGCKILKIKNTKFNGSPIFNRLQAWVVACYAFGFNQIQKITVGHTCRVKFCFSLLQFLGGVNAFAGVKSIHAHD